ncbi:hypothetical protein [Variovorax sp. YR266]|uniref:hypothetical protein n=1 Tax=Variovorax sp. YR266 TaxID=1884386 RepID=UPI00115FAE99|nr:hypothetical protein [Variovorax sp. YR266]
MTHSPAWQVIPSVEQIGTASLFSAIDNVAYEELIPISPSLRVGATELVCSAAVAVLEHPRADSGCDHIPVI